MFLSEVPVSKISMRDVSLEVKLLDDIVEKRRRHKGFDGPLGSDCGRNQSAGFINSMHQYE